MKGARCELLDEDKMSKPDDFVPDHDLGYMYYDLKQELYKGVSGTAPEPIRLKVNYFYFYTQTLQISVNNQTM